MRVRVSISAELSLRSDLAYRPIRETPAPFQSLLSFLFGPTRRRRQSRILPHRVSISAELSLRSDRSPVNTQNLLARFQSLLSFLFGPTTSTPSWSSALFWFQSLLSFLFGPTRYARHYRTSAHRRFQSLLSFLFGPTERLAVVGVVEPVSISAELSLRSDDVRTMRLHRNLQSFNLC